MHLSGAADLLALGSGGKAKPLKAAKKEAKELDEEDKAFLEKKKADEKAKKDMAAQTSGKKGPLVSLMPCAAPCTPAESA